MSSSIYTLVRVPAADCSERKRCPADTRSPEGTVERLLLRDTVTMVIKGHQIRVADLDICSNIHRESILPLKNFKTTDCGQFNIIQIIKKKF